jgi:xanthine dehydrogenase YagT iron-sulfur-binding subunit
MACDAGAAPPQESAKSTSSAAVTAATAQAVKLTINGVSREAELPPFTTLLDALRDHFDLSGTKRGCSAGACGACTVLLDGRRIKSCLTLVVMCEGCNVTTIEGLSDGDRLHPLQQAFIAYDALQCGYCTPGQIMSAAGYLAEDHHDPANPETIREQMSGNLCRCGAYSNIVAAIASIAAGDP